MKKNLGIFLIGIFLSLIISACNRQAGDATNHKNVNSTITTVAAEISSNSSLVNFDHAIASAVAEISSKVQGRTEIVIVELAAPSEEISDFLTSELSALLVKSGNFIVLERGNALEVINALNIANQMLGSLVSDTSAVGIGHYLGAKVVITGNFIPFASFSQLRLRVIDVRTAQLFAMPSSRVYPDDLVLANIMRLDKSNLPSITENALVHYNRGTDLLRENKFDEAIRELDQALILNSVCL